MRLRVFSILIESDGQRFTGARSRAAAACSIAARASTAERKSRNVGTQPVSNSPYQVSRYSRVHMTRRRPLGAIGFARFQHLRRKPASLAGKRTLGKQRRINLGVFKQRRRDFRYHFVVAVGQGRKRDIDGIAHTVRIREEWSEPRFTGRESVATSRPASLKRSALKTQAALRCLLPPPFSCPWVPTTENARVR